MKWLAPLLALLICGSTRADEPTIMRASLVEGTVTGMNKGGLELDVKGMRAFMPSGKSPAFAPNRRYPPQNSSAR